MTFVIINTVVEIKLYTVVVTYTIIFTNRVNRLIIMVLIVVNNVIVLVMKFVILALIN